MKILVVDDEPLARERLLRLIQKLYPQALALEAGNGLEALESVATEQPDLVLLDIRMPGMDGIEVAAQLQQQEQPPAVVFCTAYDRYALEALDKQAVAYLLKPVREQQLSDAIERGGRLNRLQLAELGVDASARSHVASATHKGVETLSVAQVCCFLAEQKYVRACAPDRELLISDTLKELEHEFAGQFVRVHRKALVNINHVRGLERDDEEGWRVQLDGVAETPAVSRRHLADVKSRLRDL